MRLLTFHGTVVRVSPASGELCHVGALDETEGWIDARFGDDDPWPTDRERGRFEVGEGLRPGTISLRRGDQFLCADPRDPVLLEDRTSVSIWESFVRLDDSELGLLRWILRFGWQASSKSGAGLADGIGRVTLGPDFALRVLGRTFDLALSRPTIESIGLVDDAGQVLLDRDAPLPPGKRLHLRPVSADEVPFVRVGSREEFQQRSNSALPVQFAADVLRPPITITDEDGAFFHTRHWHGEETGPDPVQTYAEIRRSPGKFVMLQRYCEGIIFDEHGGYSETGYLHTLPVFPDGLQRGMDGFSFDERMTWEAPRLDGCFAIIFNPHLTNYYHWMVEAILSLETMRDALPPGTTLLLPGTVTGFRETKQTGFDHTRILKLLGFDDLPIVEVDAPLCWVEEAIWLEGYMIENVSGAIMRQFRDRIGLRLGRDADRSRRIFVQRTGQRGFANADDLEAFCDRNGFTPVRLEEVDDLEQIRLFQEAEFVIAAHGAALANLLFCPAGTKVIELCPDAEFRPFFWRIAQNLGLVFGLLPCATTNGHFTGNIMVDMDRLDRLFERLTAAGPRVGEAV